MAYTIAVKEVVLNGTESLTQSAFAFGRFAHYKDAERVLHTLRNSARELNACQTTEHTPHWHHLYINTMKGALHTSTEYTIHHIKRDDESAEE